MATENGPGKDVSPIENRGFNCHVSSLEGKGKLRLRLFRIWSWIFGYTLWLFLTWLAGKSTMKEDVFPIENGDFPMSC